MDLHYKKTSAKLIRVRTSKKEPFNKFSLQKFVRTNFDFPIYV